MPLISDSISAPSPVESPFSDKAIGLDTKPLSESDWGPQELHLELTYNCNSRCIMCDLWDFDKRQADKKSELTLDEIKRFIQESSHLNKIDTVVLSGGEPFKKRHCRGLRGSY